MTIEERTKPIAALHPPRPGRCPVPADPPPLAIATAAGLAVVQIPAGEWVALMQALECRAAYQAALEALVDHYRAGHDAPAPPADRQFGPR